VGNITKEPIRVGSANGGVRTMAKGEQEAKKYCLTFALFSPTLRSGRGNGKRAAFGSIAFTALTSGAPPVENSEP
jgi:hypothetical protein